MPELISHISADIKARRLGVWVGPLNNINVDGATGQFTLQLQCILSGQDLIIRVMEVDSKSLTITAISSTFNGGPEYSRLETRYVTGNGGPVVDIVYPSTVDADTIKTAFTASVGSFSTGAQIECVGNNDVNRIWLNATAPRLAIDIDDHPLLSDFPVTPIISAVCGNDGGSPLGLTVTFTADSGASIHYVANNSSLLVDNMKGSLPGLFTISGQDTPTLVVTYPNTFDTEQIRTDVHLIVAGHDFPSVIEDCGGVRPLWVFVDETYNLIGNFQNVPPIIDSVNIGFRNVQSGEWANGGSGQLPLSNLGIVVTSAGNNESGLSLTPFVVGTLSWPLEIELWIYDWRLFGSPQAATTTLMGAFGFPGGNFSSFIGNALTPSVPWPFTTSAQVPPWNTFVNARFSGYHRVQADGTFEWDLE